MFVLITGSLPLLITPNPLLIIIWLIIVTFLLGALGGLILNTWIMGVTVLLFTGGIIVLFSYMVTLIRAKKIVFDLFFKVYFLFWVLALVLSNFRTRLLYSYLSLNLSTMFIIRSVTPLFFLGGYLLITLLVVVKIAVFFEGPLKSSLQHEN